MAIKEAVIIGGVDKYKKRNFGPILDRIDIMLYMSQVNLLAHVHEILRGNSFSVNALSK